MFSFLLLCLSFFTQTSTTVYDFSITSIDGKEINLEEYKGKKILLVNVASKCGYTFQYEGLQKLYEQNKENLVIIGLPCNQFMHQEPGTNKEIKSFCTKNYGVTFPITEKVNVKGDKIHPLYNWLTRKELNGVEESKVKWNFQKYLIDEEGKLVQVFGSKVEPLSPEIIDAINS
jgi:glutathione peroxidase